MTKQPATRTVVNALLAYQRDYPTMREKWSKVYIEHMDAYYANAVKCAGCGALRVRHERYCWYCGADSEDMFGRILDFDLDKLPIYAVGRGAPTKELASTARKLARYVLGSDARNISIRVARGTGYVQAVFPHDHDWTVVANGCRAREMREDGTLRGFRACPYCARRAEAITRFQSMLVRAIAGTEDRSDSQRDYFDFIWIVS